VKYEVIAHGMVEEEHWFVRMNIKCTW